MSRYLQLTRFIACCALSLILLPTLAAAAKATSPINIQHWQTNNGAKVYFVHEPQLPMVDVAIVFTAGSAYDGKHPGIAQLTNNLLFSGSKNLSANQIATRLDAIGTQYGNSVNRDMAQISFRSLTRKNTLSKTVNIISNALADADFPENALMRKRNQQLAAIKARQQSPGTVAGEVFMHLLYHGYPYAHSSLGTAKSTENIDRNQVKQFYQRYYVAKNALIAIVGNVSKQQAESIANTMTAKLNSGKRAAALPKISFTAKAIKRQVAFPVKQTHIRFGTLGIQRDNPDYYALAVGNYILGGGAMTSRLNHEVRDKRGLSYFAISSFVPMLQRGPFIIGLQTQNTNAAEALQVAKRVLSRFLHTGPSSQEIQAAKQYLIGSFPLKLDSNSAIIANVINIGFYHLPLNTLANYRKNIKAVNRKDIMQAFHTYINPKKLVTVVVGGDGKS